MPRIIINDVDQTVAAGTTNTDYAVYVPGLQGSGGVLTAADGPTLFESLSSFKATVGSAPSTINAANQSGEPDLSYVYAAELLGAGLPIVYQIIADADQVNYAALKKTDICDLIAGLDISAINDRGSFDVSFVTTGGYPTVYQSESIDGSETVVEIKDNISKLTDVTLVRGDCFAIIDVDDNIEVHTVDDLPDVIKGISNSEAFVVLPSNTFSPNYSGIADTVLMPGSFHYLRDFAVSIKINASWFAIAGVKRGLVAGAPAYLITNDEADALQPDTGTSVNAITNIKPYGRCIWGNRTLLKNDTGTTASSYINVRQLVHDIKRQLYKTAKALMFSPNDDILWVNFRNSISPLLDKMQSGQGITGYRLIKVESPARATLTAKIIITPIEAVENFILTVILTDENVNVEG